ncbi:tRNA (adenosine(37)-N6)-threonylcarbamoyltransferase complex ATPase subunit type 1 TsaE [Leptothrix discophora]|uniref:tRNA threonylcarbamoyladenosine biosynthesis protein TsaE n=1 Tax=Leptothrix discophora TaxID=89 RepID=A0ABT9G077_LEPDI|nr:tRNA (adenosine(37)-N6)-threonylcarbamoyltransferase complex ATPase subunit type 1 TsaE [Leptothrix discophora]MDP4299871.1 tRNA (adenosine(37)-N6)-threonylcarbamoyltransferase complex ATPase subunit type 1 TsaE [Leptothrix discophora]
MNRHLALTWSDEAACDAMARRLAALPALRGACIALHGGLGAGKTTWVRHLLRALCITGRIKSPSYAIVEPYALPAGPSGEPPAGDAWHFDFYRFGDPQEWEDAGFRELFAAPGLKLVEWPERIAGLTGPADLALTIEARLDGSRAVQVDAGTPLGEALLAALADAVQPSPTQPWFSP